MLAEHKCVTRTPQQESSIWFAMSTCYNSDEVKHEHTCAARMDA